MSEQETKKGKAGPTDLDGKSYNDYLKEMHIDVSGDDNHYVDNKELYKHMCAYCQARDEALAKGLPKPPVDNYIGESIMKIATHLSFRPNFIGYSYRYDMIGDAIDNCLTYIDSFDPAKSKNPFSYLTQVCWCAFIRRLKLEKRQSIIKGKYMMTHDSLSSMSFDSEDDEQNVTDISNVHTYMLLAEEDDQKQAALKKQQAEKREALKQATRVVTPLEGYFINEEKE